MSEDIKFEQQGNYVRGIVQGQPFYLYGMAGHTGYIKMAAQVCGLSLWGMGRKSNQLGSSNPVLYIVFPNGPDILLERKLEEIYRTLSRDAAHKRGEEKKEVSPRQPRKVKQEKPMKQFLVSVNEILNPELPRLEKIFSATSAYAAKELYEQWFEQEYKTYCTHGLKAKEVK